MAIGEAGSITTSSPGINTPISITFDEPLTDPVIVLTGTQNGGDPYNLRVIDIQTDANGDATGFTFIIEEWEYLDGAHPATETINFLAIETGTHTLPDGRVITAGTTTATSGESTVDLGDDFDSPPVVLTSVMSNNDPISVDSDAYDITADGFTVSLQEEEAQADDHGSETVGYIAIEGGTGAIVQGGLDERVDTVGLGGTFADPITVADTQTMNGTDPANVMIDGGNGSSNVDLYVQEEQSANSEVGHVNEDVGVITFERGAIMCFTPGTLIDTPFGPREITTLQRGDLVLTEDSGPQPISLITDTEILNPDTDSAPILIRANAFGPGVPAQDMRVSPQHRILLGGWRAQMLFGEEEVLAPAKGLINDHNIMRDTKARSARYIHLALQGHHILTSDGLQSESLHLGHIEKGLISDKAREEIFHLCPNLRTDPFNWGQTARPALSVRETRLIA